MAHAVVAELVLVMLVTRASCVTNALMAFMSSLKTMAEWFAHVS